jgi:hypothetical protein
MDSIRKYLSIFEKASDAYEENHPHWREEVILSLINWSLKNLRHFIEISKPAGVTWENSFVDLRYPIGWNWEAPGKGDIAPGGHRFGKLTPHNTATHELAVKTVGEIMARQFTALALADITNWIWYEVRKSYYTPALPLELVAELDAIKGKEARRSAFVALAHPYSIGAALVDYEGMEMEPGVPVPAKITKKLAGIGELIDIPRFQFDGEINGRKIETSLVFQVHPLVADYDRRKAYHRITVGLFFEPKISGKEVIVHTPEKWPKRDRMAFWNDLFQAVDRLIEELIPKREAEESIILTVNSKIKVPAHRWRSDKRGETIRQLADAYAGAGELVDFQVGTSLSGGDPQVPAACAVCGWRHDAGFTQIQIPGHEVVSLAGVLPGIVRLVHDAHEKGFPGLSTKNDALLDACGGYRHPCKAFDDLKRRHEYQLLFDTRRRGFISLRGAAGRTRNKSEASPE